MDPHRGAVIFPLILISFILTTSATGWMSFRGDEKNQGSSSVDLDPSLLKLDWEYRADAKITGTVVGYDDRVAFTTRNGSLYVLDAESGAFVYKRQPTDRFKAPSVLIPEEDAIIVSTENGTMIRYRFSSGELIWSVSLGENASVKASPNFTGDSLVITTDGSDVFCLNTNNGSQKWSFGGCGDRVETTPSFYSDGEVDLVIFGACDNYLYALDMKNGKLVWNFKAEWFPASSAIFEGKVVIGSVDQNLHCLDAATGDLIWKRDLGSSIFSSASVDEKGIAVGSDDHGLVIVNWTGDIWAKTDLGTGTRTSPVLVGDVVLVATEDGLFVVSRYDGSILRGFELGDAVDQSPSIIDNRFFFGDSNGYVRAISEKIVVEIEPLDMGVEDDPDRDIMVLIIGGLFFIIFCVTIYVGYRRIRGGNSS